MKGNNIRWLVHGILTELFYNIFFRTINRRIQKEKRLSFDKRMFATAKEEKRLVLGNNNKQYRQPPKHELAIVTGATGGIGLQIARINMARDHLLLLWQWRVYSIYRYYDVTLMLIGIYVHILPDPLN